MPKYHVTLRTTHYVYNVYELVAADEDAAVELVFDGTGEVVEEWIAEDSEQEVTNIESDDDTVV